MEDLSDVFEKAVEIGGILAEGLTSHSRSIHGGHTRLCVS